MCRLDLPFAGQTYVKHTYLGQLVDQEDPTPLSFCYWLHDPWHRRLPELLHKQAVVLQHSRRLSDSQDGQACTCSAPCLLSLHTWIVVALYLRKYVCDWDKVSHQTRKDILLLLLHIPLHILDHQVLKDAQIDMMMMQ